MDPSSSSSNGAGGTAMHTGGSGGGHVLKRVMYNGACPEVLHSVNLAHRLQGVEARLYAG